MISVVHDADMDMWREIDHGERPISWEAWFGSTDGADYLTDEGKKVLRRAVDDLTAFFGRTWLDRALQPGLDPRGPRIRRLGASSPVLALAPARRPGAYVESIRWWASLQLLAVNRVQGFEAVRRDARNDLSAHRLMHTLTQARLAAIGAYLGASVTVEPGKAGGPGDVLLGHPGEEVFLEIVTFGPDETREIEEGHQQRHMMHLMALANVPIYWKGYVPGYLNKADETTWLRLTTDAAAQCVRTGKSFEIPGPDGQVLVVKPGKQPPGTGTFGPNLDLDFSARLTHILDRKGAQTRGAGIAWIWIEDYGGVHALHPFTKLPLHSKISALAALAGPALADRLHVAGIIWSGVFRCSPLPPDEQAEGDRGLAFQKGLPIEHVRQTVIVNRSLILPGQTRILAQACDREPRWLDWALRQLDVTGGVRSLLSQPPQAQASTLWIPPPRR
jgi:hypothetical protein